MIADLDIKQVCDYLLHLVLDHVNVARGISLDARIAALIDYLDKEGFAKIGGMGETDIFGYGKGGMRGGVRTPDEFRNLVKQLFTPIVKRWNRDKVGFKMPNEGYGEPGTETLVNLITFADNFTLCASSFEELQTMINELTAKIQEAGLTWKVRKN